MDISKLSQEREQDDVGIDVPIFRRDKEPDLASDGTQTTFTVLGRDSTAVRKVFEKQQRAWSRHRGPIDPQRLLDNRVEIAVAALVGWHGVESNGEPVPLTPESARQVLSDRHYLEQAEVGIDDHARFFKTGSSS